MAKKRGKLELGVALLTSTHTLHQPQLHALHQPQLHTLVALVEASSMTSSPLSSLLSGQLC